MMDGISSGMGGGPDMGMFSDSPGSGPFNDRSGRGGGGEAPSFQPNYPPNLQMLVDINMQVTVELGRTQMTVRQVLDLQKGSVIELDRIAGDAVDIYVNDRLVAKGDVVVVDDKFGVRITELVSPVRTQGND